MLVPIIDSTITPNDPNAWETLLRVCAPIASATHENANDAIRSAPKSNAVCSMSKPGSSEANAMKGVMAAK